MIASLRGTVLFKGTDHVIVEVSGIGYHVHMHAQSLAPLRAGAAVALWTHEHARDDGRELFGFLSRSELLLFKRLFAISGIGPKTALAMLALGTIDEIEKRIEAADVAWLSSAPGVGKKTAQKIVLELKGKLVDVKADDDVVSALVNLGYSREHALEASRAVPAEGSIEDRIRESLKRVGK
jgi:Holliday junction DNA helicase RuvA